MHALHTEVIYIYILMYVFSFLDGFLYKYFTRHHNNSSTSLKKKIANRNLNQGETVVHQKMSN